MKNCEYCVGLHVRRFDINISTDTPGIFILVANLPHDPTQLFWHHSPLWNLEVVGAKCILVQISQF